MTKIKYAAITLLLLQLNGCFIMTTSDVVQVGKDTYMLNSTGRGGDNTRETTIKTTPNTSKDFEAIRKKKKKRQKKISGGTWFLPIVWQN